MITKMKKLTFLVYHREYDEFLHRLQELGVMHIEGGSLDKGQSEAVSADMTELRRVDTLLQQMEQLPAPDAKETGAMEHGDSAFDSTTDLIQTLETLFADYAQLTDRAKALTEQIETLTPWGEFDPVEVRRELATAGCELRFYTASPKAFTKDIAPNFIVQEIHQEKKKVYFVAINHGEEQDIPATAVTIPDASLSALTAEFEQTSAQSAQTLSKLQQLTAAHRAEVEACRDQLQSRMNFDTVRFGTETAADDHLMVLRGWIPAGREEEVQTTFAGSSAWFEISDPQPGDDIPICLKNNRFFKLFEMFTELYMLPKYTELDLTPYLAPFYILFFGLCLGDSGYGLFITLGVLAVKHFVKGLSQSLKAALNLLLVLGISAFFCGLLSGAFFGFNLYTLGVPFFDKVGAAVAMDNSQMFNLSLILGFIQIIFGMSLKVYNRAIQLGFSYALSTIGWMMVILSLAVVMLLPDYAHIAKWFTYVGLALAFLCNSPERYSKNPVTGLLINVGSGLWDAYNTATGMLGDMLSYVRLFALGLSGGILATVFDSLATGLAPDNAILGPIVMVLIFVFGHALNMFMNVLGAFVHPMRLTFVEFFKNAGYEGGGTTYKPFK